MAADVCKALDITNVGNALARLDDDEKGSIRLTDITPNGGNPNVSIVNEPGLYSLVLGSRKPEAKAFKRWITHEAIPSIRKHGAYMTPAAIERILSDPDTIIQLATSLKEERQRSQVLEAENQMMKPKADYFDALVDRNLLTNFRETAKSLEVKPKAFVTELLRLKYIYRDQRGKLMPYQSHVDGGLFEVKECCSEKNTWSGTQTLITPKGRETFRLLFAGIT